MMPLPTKTPGVNEKVISLPGTNTGKLFKVIEYQNLPHGFAITNLHDWYDGQRINNAVNIPIGSIVMWLEISNLKHQFIKILHLDKILYIESCFLEELEIEK